MEQAWLPVRIETKTSIARDIVAFEMAHAGGGDLPRFAAGSHVDVEVRPGLVRQYSLVHLGEETGRYLIAVLNDPKSRGGSIAMHLLEPGALLRISEPRNHFALQNGAVRTLLFAGGIGITPILTMAERLSRTGADFLLHYGVREADRCAFESHLKTCSFANRIRIYYSEGENPRPLDLQQAIHPYERDDHLYVCGPSPMIEAVYSAAEAKGWPGLALHKEAFSAPAPAAGSDTAFVIRIASSGAVVAVEAGCSVVDALASAGVSLPTSCTVGVCGTCLTRILEGTPDHRDSYLTDDEQARNDQFLPCVSRAHSAEIVLDL